MRPRYKKATHVTAPSKSTSWVWFTVLTLLISNILTLIFSKWFFGGSSDTIGALSGGSLRASANLRSPGYGKAKPIAVSGMLKDFGCNLHTGMQIYQQPGKGKKIVIVGVWQGQDVVAAYQAGYTVYAFEPNFYYVVKLMERIDKQAAKLDMNYKVCCPS
jgi:hypothetical protein